MTREQLAAVLGDEKASGSVLDVLSDREMEVLSLMSQGSNTFFICREMLVNEEELKRLKDSIRKKVGLKDEVALLQFAVKQKRESGSF